MMMGVHRLSGGKATAVIFTPLKKGLNGPGGMVLGKEASIGARSRISAHLSRFNLSTVP